MVRAKVWGRCLEWGAIESEIAYKGASEPSLNLMS